MMGLTVMAVALHLDRNYGQTPCSVNNVVCMALCGGEDRHRSLDGCHNLLLFCRVRFARLLKQLNDALVQAIAQFKPLGGTRHIAHLYPDAG